MIADQRDQLGLGHLVGGLDFGESAVKVFVPSDPFIEFAFGLAGADDEDRFGIFDPIDDIVVEAIEVLVIASILVVTRFAVRGGVGSRAPCPAMVTEVLADLRLDLVHRIARGLQPDDDGTFVVDPQTDLISH
jgi:hypothetical protein